MTDDVVRGTNQQLDHWLRTAPLPPGAPFAAELEQAVRRHR